MGLIERVKHTFRTRDRFTGLLWAVVIAWGTFPFLYWAIRSGLGWLVTLGLVLLAVACALAVYFG